MNKVIAAKWPNDKRIGVLDHSLYATGMHYFFLKQDLYMFIHPLMAHANYMTTTREKVVRLEERELWYLDEMNEEKRNWRSAQI